MARPQTYQEDDRLPEADRLDDFPHPRERDRLLGHEDAQSEFLENYKNGRLHHAWLLSGPKGIGKATLAYRFARALLTQSDAPPASGAGEFQIGPDTPAFRQIAAGAHPDLFVLRRIYDPKRKVLQSQLVVGEVRKARNFTTRTAAGGGYRVCIVDSVDDMNTAAANALLKILEEPPGKLVFLVISHAPGRLLPTIRSRCRKLPLHPLSDRHVAEILGELGDGNGSKDTMATISALAEGSAGRALLLGRAGGLEIYETLIELLETLPALDQSKLHDFTDKFAQRGSHEHFGLFAEFLSGWLARLARHADRATSIPLPREARIAERLAPPGTGGLWAQRWQEINHSLQHTNVLNLDPKQAVLNIFFDLENAARQVH